MSSLASLILLPQTVYQNEGTSQPMQVEGVPVKAAAYYLSNKYIQTASYDLIDFRGTLLIQATLESEPDTENWFSVLELQYEDNITVTDFVNIEGNFSYIRAALRDFSNGTVNYVRLAY